MTSFDLPHVSQRADSLRNEGAGRLWNLQMNKVEREKIVRAAREIWLSVAQLAQVVVPALLDGLVVVTMLTTLTVILGILVYATPSDPKQSISPLAIFWCVVTALIGGAAAFLQIKKVYRRTIGRDRLNEFIASGNAIETNLKRANMNSPCADFDSAIDEWQRLVLTFLSSYFPEHTAHFQSDAGLENVGDYVGHPERSNRIKLMDRRISRLNELLIKT